MAGGGVLLLVAAAAALAGAQPCPPGLPEACSCDNPNKLVWVSVRCDFTGNREQNFIIEKNMLPNKTKEVFVTGAFYMRTEKNAFSNLEQFEKLDIKSVRNLTISALSFEKTNTNKLDLIVFNTDSVLIESDAFLNISGGIEANISNCNFVKLENESFIRVISIWINNVPRLHLYGKVFQNKIHRHFSSQAKAHTKVHFYNVTVNTLEEGCFSAGVSEVNIIKSNITTISSRTFKSKEYAWVMINSSEITTIEVDAFHYDNFFKKLTFDDCIIRTIESGAINTSSDCLTLSHSMIDHIEKKGISIIAAHANISDNKFVKVDDGGINLNQWNTLLIERNIFEEMSNITADPSSVTEFRFTNNYMEKLNVGGLHFINKIFKPDSNLQISNYSYNHFKQICSCEIKDWLKTIFVEQSENESLPLTKIYEENSFCSVHRKCGNFIIQGHMLIPRYMDIYCDESKNISCIDARRNIIKEIPNLKYHYNFPPLVESDPFSKEVTSKLFLWLLLIIVVLLIGIIILVLICRKIRQRSHCTNVKNEITSCFTRFDRMFGANNGIDSASISQVSINDYNENHMLQDITLNEDPGTLTNGNSLEELIDTADKATQTLPEELTKELLESLREKLDDPENYSEARETIEHLYDLIKVEEYCNMNNNNSTRHRYNHNESIENMYDVIQQPLILQGKNKKNMVSKGTKVPSLEKLSQTSPISKLCNEYFEPRDRTVHLYSELTPNRNIPCDKNKSDAINFLRVIETNMDHPNVFNNAIQTSITPSIMAGPSGLNASNATQRSNRSSKSATSDGSSIMANRPLPEKPRDPS